MTTVKSKDKVEPKTKSTRINADEVKKGDIVAVLYYVQVNEVNTVKDKSGRNLKQLTVTDLDSGLGGITITGQELIESCFSADQFHKEEKVTKTKAAEVLMTSYNRPLQVCFEKQNGEERVLRGRLIQPEPVMGRSHVDDLDVPRNEHRMRLVDHRSLKYLVVDGTKFTVKP